MGDGKVVLFATGNQHKVAELSMVLGECGYRVQLASAPKIEVQSDNLVEIAVHAVSTAYLALGRPVAVEDAGLFVDALSGFPGPYSSYVYKTIGVRGLLRLMEGVEDRSARFLSVIAYAGPWGVRVFTGQVQGVITREPRGGQGFGFDPIFSPYGAAGRTFAEMSLEEKNKWSHRARAAREMCEWLVDG